MLKSCIFKLNSPLCSCQSQSIQWSIIPEPESGLFGIAFTCQNCGTKLKVPHAEFRAFIKIGNKFANIKESRSNSQALCKAAKYGWKLLQGGKNND